MSFAQKSEKKWTEEEDEILRAAVAEYAKGAKINWQKISDCLPGRSNKSCRKRWIHSLDPTLRKGRWTSAEDAVLLDAVAMHGQNWSKVARHVEGRTDDQCAKRWRENLDPSISREPWTPEEDRTLVEALKVHGQKWNTISTLLPGRASVHCRNRYSRLRRARDTTSSQQDGGSSPSGRSSPDPSPSYPTPIDSRNRRLPEELLRLNVDTGSPISRHSTHGSLPSASSEPSRSSMSTSSPLSSSIYDVPGTSASGLHLSLSPTSSTSAHRTAPSMPVHSHAHHPTANNQPELSNRLLEAFFNDNSQVRNREGRWYPQPGDDVFLFSTSQEEEFMRNIQHDPSYRTSNVDMNINHIPFSSTNVPNPGNRGYDAGRSYLPNLTGSFQGAYADEGASISDMGTLLTSMDTGGQDYQSVGSSGAAQTHHSVPYPTSSQQGAPRYDRSRYHPQSQSHLHSPLDPMSHHSTSSRVPWLLSRQSRDDPNIGGNYAQQPSRVPFDMPTLDSSNEALSLATLSTWLSMTLPPNDTTPEVSGSTSPGSSSTFESSPSPADEDGYSTVHDR